MNLAGIERKSERDWELPQMAGSGRTGTPFRRALNVRNAAHPCRSNFHGE
jgi:hypothetical protein